MKYSICIAKNRLPKQLDLKKYLIDWFAKYTPLEIETNVIETDFDVTTKQVTNGKVTGVIVGDDIISKLQTVIPEGKYNTVLFIYGNDLDGIRVSACGGSIYTDTELIQTFIYKDGGKVANHELIHAFFQKLRKLQINLQDPMDTYLNDSDLSVDNIIDTNREQALQLLKPHWDKICSFRSLSTKPSSIVNPLSTWKYFKLTEKTGSLGHTIADLKKELVDLMDKMRGECGFSWIITSGYRTVAENNSLPGAVSDSAHTTREAVDIYCVDDRKRQILLDVVRKNGINRIGLGKTFIHIDISKTLPQNVTWNY